MTEKYESARSREEIVDGFATQYAANIRILHQANPQVDIEKLLRGVDEYHHEARLAAVAAYGALPQSTGERKWLMTEAMKEQSLLPDDAGTALCGYVQDAKGVRLALSLDWRDGIGAIFIKSKFDENEKDALARVNRDFLPELASFLDTIMLTVQPFDLSKEQTPLFTILERGEQAGLVTKKDADRLRTYLQEFIVGPKRNPPLF